jgi:hypothetical protein
VRTRKLFTESEITLSKGARTWAIRAEKRIRIKVRSKTIKNRNRKSRASQTSNPKASYRGDQIPQATVRVLCLFSWKARQAKFVDCGSVRPRGEYVSFEASEVVCSFQENEY